MIDVSTPFGDHAGMLAHNVYFSLKDKSPTAVERLVRGCHEKLNQAPGILFFACGTLEPELARPVNDRDFDVAVHLVFESRAAHDNYQASAAHQEFIEQHKDNWESSRVFDSIVKSEA